MRSESRRSVIGKAVKKELLISAKLGRRLIIIGASGTEGRDRELGVYSCKCSIFLAKWLFSWPPGGRDFDPDTQTVPDNPDATILRRPAAAAKVRAGKFTSQQ